jgi:hypothetical protein
MKEIIYRSNPKLNWTVSPQAVVLFKNAMRFICALVLGTSVSFHSEHAMGATDFDLFNGTNSAIAVVSKPAILNAESQKPSTTMGQEGNGGGLTWDAGTLKTIGECAAALNILKSPGNIQLPNASVAYLQIDEATKQEVVRLVNLLPITSGLKDHLVEQALQTQTPHTLIRAAGIAPAVEQKVKKDYAVAIANFGSQLPPDFVILGAVTSTDLDATLGTTGFNDTTGNSKTVFLPGFDLLQPTSRALLLIHESRQRWLLDQREFFTEIKYGATEPSIVSDPIERLAHILELDSTLHLLNTGDPNLVNNPMRVLGALQNVLPPIKRWAPESLLIGYSRSELSQSTALLAIRELMVKTGLVALPFVYFRNSNDFSQAKSEILSFHLLGSSPYDGDHTSAKTAKADPVSLNRMTIYDYPAVQIFRNTPIFSEWMVPTDAAKEHLGKLCKTLAEKFSEKTNPTSMFLWTPTLDQLATTSNLDPIFENKIYLVECENGTYRTVRRHYELRFERAQPAFN